MFLLFFDISLIKSLIFFFFRKKGGMLFCIYMIDIYVFRMCYIGFF